MEISFIKNHGCQIEVIFTGSKYVFTNSFYGLLVVATRRSVGGETNQYFTLEVETESNLGSSFFEPQALVRLAQRFIKKSENKYITTNIFWEVQFKDVNNTYYININVEKR